jgi:hypothetical protein
MNYIFSFAAAALLVIGLAGNGFEMRRTRLSTVRDEAMSTRTMFASRGNFKWYACIGAALALIAISNVHT